MATIRDERALQLIALGRYKDAAERLHYKEGYDYREAKELIELYRMGESEGSLKPLELLRRIRSIEQDIRDLIRRL